MINEAALAMEYGASCEDVARVCHAHPVSFFSSENPPFSVFSDENPHFLAQKSLTESSRGLRCKKICKMCSCKNSAKFVQNGV